MKNECCAINKKKFFCELWCNFITKIEMKSVVMMTKKKLKKTLSEHIYYFFDFSPVRTKNSFHVLENQIKMAETSMDYSTEYSENDNENSPMPVAKVRESVSLLVLLNTTTTKKLVGGTRVVACV